MKAHLNFGTKLQCGSIELKKAMGHQARQKKRPLRNKKMNL